MTSNNSFKRISHPSSTMLLWILAPAVIALITSGIMGVFPRWTLVFTICSMLIYLGVCSYFCIKQKCMKELVVLAIAVLMAIGILLPLGF